MRVFILCTGRCGSFSFIKACSHIDNYTSDHESLSGKFGVERFEYPENHIEADNRLSWHLGQLNKLFGNSPFYIHLKRERKKVAQSYFKRYYRAGSIIDAFCDGVRVTPKESLSNEMRLQVCYDYVDTVNANIEDFIRDKDHTMTVNLEKIDSDFPVFWERIRAKGDLQTAMKEFNTAYNTSSERRFRILYRSKLVLIRECRYIFEHTRSELKKVFKKKDEII